MGIQITTLGKLQLRNHAHNIDFGSFPTRQVEELLIYLMLNPCLRHSRLKLIHLLWPDCSEKTGRGRLNTTLWRLRNVFKYLEIPPENIITTTKTWVCLTPTELIQTDFETFQSHEKKARLASEPYQKERYIQMALNLYQGEFCEGIYAEWCLSERERLAQTHIRLLSQFMNLCLDHLNFERAAAIGKKILDVDPLREEVHRTVMYCFSRLGWYAKAVQQYHICLRLLRTELDVDPMTETQILFNQIMFEYRGNALVQDKYFFFTKSEFNEVVGRLHSANQKLDYLLNEFEGIA